MPDEFNSKEQVATRRVARLKNGGCPCNGCRYFDYECDGSESCPAAQHVEGCYWEGKD